MIRRLKHWQIVLLILVTLIVLKLATTTFAVVRAWQATGHLRDVLLQPAPDEFADALAQAGSAAEGLLAEVGLARRPVLALAGADGCNLGLLLDSAHLAARAAQTLDGVAAALVATAGSSGAESIPVERLRTAWNAVDSAPLRAEAERLDATICPRTDSAVQRYADESAGLVALLDLGLAAPWDGALADNSRWLILLNNSDELRATGGFTTAVIDIVVSDGAARWRLLNSSSVDNPATYFYHPAPPLPQARYMGLTRWLFRDANWSPDYPTTARQALAFFHLDQGDPPPSVVITVNLPAITTLLRHLPPLTVDGQPFGEATALDRLREAWYNDGVQLQLADSQRKDFLRDYAVMLADAVRTQASPRDLLALGSALVEMLDRREILLYADDPALQAALAARGWDGALRPTDGDYLMVVNANFGYNKVSPRVAQSLDYAVRLGDSPQASLGLTYVNENTLPAPCSDISWGQFIGHETETYDDRMMACYWNYARVFVPPGSALTDYSGADMPADWFPATHTAQRALVDAFREGDYPGFGLMTIVPPNERRALTFDYSLPAEVVERSGATSRYRLTVQRQPAALRTSYRITVTLPPGATFLSASPQASVEGSSVSFAGDLDADLSLTVEFTTPG